MLWNVLKESSERIRIPRIDRVVGVIWSDLNGPVTPLDRNVNRYMINFVDHAFNHCRMFVARKRTLLRRCNSISNFFRLLFWLPIPHFKDGSRRQISQCRNVLQVGWVNKTSKRDKKTSTKWKGRTHAYYCAKYEPMHVVLKWLAFTILGFCGAVRRV